MVHAHTHLSLKQLYAILGSDQEPLLRSQPLSMFPSAKAQSVWPLFFFPIMFGLSFYVLVILIILQYPIHLAITSAALTMSLAYSITTTVMRWKRAAILSWIVTFVTAYLLFYDLLQLKFVLPPFQLQLPSISQNAIQFFAFLTTIPANLIVIYQFVASRHRKEAR